VTQFGNVPMTMTVPPAAVHVTVDVEGPTDLPLVATSNNMESTQPNVTMLATHVSYLSLQLALMGALPVTHFGNVQPAATKMNIMIGTENGEGKYGLSSIGAAGLNEKEDVMAFVQQYLEPLTYVTTWDGNVIHLAVHATACQATLFLLA